MIMIVVMILMITITIRIKNNNNNNNNYNNNRITITITIAIITITMILIVTFFTHQNNLHHHQICLAKIGACRPSEITILNNKVISSNFGLQHMSHESYLWFRRGGAITMTSHERHAVSNHLSLECLFNSLCGPTSKKHQSPRYWPYLMPNTGETVELHAIVWYALPRNIIWTPDTMDPNAIRLRYDIP